MKMLDRFPAIVGRIIDAMQLGNVEVIENLFNWDILRPHDVFKLSDDYEVSLLHILARYPCVDMAHMIDMMLNYGVVLNEAQPYTALEEAIRHQNFPTAMYLQNLGGVYDDENVMGTIDEYTTYKTQINALNNSHLN